MYSIAAPEPVAHSERKDHVAALAKQLQHQARWFIEWA